MDSILSGKFGFSIKPKTTDELYELAYVDPLTKTYNRNMLEELRDKFDTQELFITMVDMDNLKTINDMQGHDAGDLAICTVASYLKIISHIVFRLGGDEFLLVDQSPIDPFLDNISFGLVSKDKDEPLGLAMKRADLFMYDKKKAKKKKELNCRYGAINTYKNNDRRSIIDALNEQGDLTDFCSEIENL